MFKNIFRDIIYIHNKLRKKSQVYKIVIEKNIYK